MRLPSAGVRLDDQSEDQAMMLSNAVDDDLEPKEKGSESVERRIEKVMSELRDRSLVDVSDEKAYEEKKVSCNIRIPHALNEFNNKNSTDGDLVGSVHCLPAGCV